MAQTLTCSQGHRWEAAAAGDAATLLCPVCASSSLAPERISAATLPASPPARLSGVLAVPGYEMLGELGRGGMSIVYKARHLKLNRLVALKMLTAGAHAGPDLLQRFQREGESLARLTHPNIVQIHEVGWIEPQGPYLTLEYVEGGSLSQKLARLPQPPRQAAAMVAVLARAVHFAHEHGVLHRDLKPANVMLTTDGSPKVADFGLARFLQVEAGSGSDSPTPTGAILGTPSYMAPEQASGVTRAPTAAVDVYALGAILYEMLTGRPPFLAEGPMETTLLVITEDPVPPRRLQSKIPHDLETICLHCLRKNPRERYPSAAALANDLQRFLDEKPIVVRPAGPAERLVKWAKRRPAVATLLAVSVLAVLAGLGLSGWYQFQLYEKNVHLEQANHDLQTEKDLYNGLLIAAVDNLSDYGDAVDDAVEPLPGSEPARRALLEKRLEFFAPFLTLSPDNPKLQQRKARGLFEAAKIHQKLGEPAKAEEEFNEAVNLYETARSGGDTAELRHELGRSRIQLGILLAGLRRRDEAEFQLNRGVGLLQGLVDETATDAVVRRNLSTAYHSLANLQMAERRWPEALEAYQKAVDLCKELIAEDDKDDRYKVLLAEAYADRCGMYRLKGEPDRARDDADAALEEFRKVGPDWSGQEACQNSRAAVHYHRALLLTIAEPAKAFEDYEEAWKGWDRLRRSHPDVPRYRFQAAEVRSMMGRLRLADNPVEAEMFFREADQLYLDLLAASKDDADYKAARDQNRYYLGVALHALNQDDEAESIYRELIGRSPKDPWILHDLGDLLLAQADHSRQRAKVIGALPPIGLAVMPNPLGMRQAYIGQQLSAAREWKAAAQRFREALNRLTEAGKYGEGRVPPGALRQFAQQRFAAANGLEWSVFSIYDPALRAFARDQLRSVADAKAELAAAWPSLSTEGDAAAHFRQAAGDACACLFLARTDDALTADEKAALEQDAGEYAVQLLHKAVAAGYRNAEEMRRSFDIILSDYHPYLRPAREDLKKLLKELENPRQP